MNRLARQQTALLEALFERPGVPLPGGIDAQHAPPGFVGARGLLAYQANAVALARRSLGAAFPVLVQLLGDENFEPLAVEFWCREPPLRGDLAQWGDALPDFLRRNRQLADEPYLGDVAAVEWAMHQAALAADQRDDLASFARLAQPDAPGLRLRLASGTTVLVSRYPVASIVAAHLTGSPSLAQAGAMLRDRQGENTLVWRQGMRAQARACDAAEVALVTALARGDALGDALAKAEGLDFSDWLTQAVQTGLALGVQDSVRSA